KETPEAARLERKKAGTAIPGGHETILVVEDEEMLRELVSVLLTSNGYRVISAEDGVVALEQYDAHRHEIAAVVCDIGLPRLDGIEVIKSLHKRDPVLKCILATGYLDQKSRDKLKSLGTYEYIQKPYQPDELLWKVRVLLDAK
ncbi:MAG TPA: response regulator, partial [Bacteroidota bacterium]|nr:response regulator [Bacteroidota bacterium]